MQAQAKSGLNIGFARSRGSQVAAGYQCDVQKQRVVVEKVRKLILLNKTLHHALDCGKP